MPTISTLEPTRYEVTARHADGREFLVSYAAGSPSARALLRIIQSRAETLVATLGLAGDATLSPFRYKPRPHVTCGDWHIGFTGRTQRDVRADGRSHPFIGG